ncbi:MAG: ribulose-5-phosphate 4-epimerase/fuculose-1-phosphate aldolase [Acidimicrobiales bacterium]|jgi:ribulose-5-phosphate 4-epimerase/fuculose-1-phosphate aldolase
MTSSTPMTTSTPTSTSKSIVDTGARPSGCGEDEWQLRCDLAALYRLADQFGMSDLIYTHISARLPGPRHQFLLNPFGVLFKDMLASDLIKVDEAGNIVDPDPSPDPDRAVMVHKAGFIIHSAVHMARPDLQCVIHSHSVAGMAVSAQEQGLLPLTQHAMMFYERVGYHDYESFANNEGERERLAHDLGEHDVLILRNHGLLVGGRSVQQAFHNATHLERACQAQVLAGNGGAVLRFPDTGAARRTSQHNKDGFTDERFEIVWRACLGMIPEDRRDYRR